MKKSKKREQRERENFSLFFVFLSSCTMQAAGRIVFLELEVFFEAVAFLHVRFARVRFILELFFIFETNFFLLHDGEFDLIRRAHLLCILKRHHT